MSAVEYMTAPLIPEAHYHIYNRSNGYSRLFFTHNNYLFFKDRLRKYSEGYFKIYAYALLPDHFHVLIKVLPQELIMERALQSKKRISRQFLARLILNGHTTQNIQELQYLADIPVADELRRKICQWLIAEQWRKLFLSYSKAVNLQQKRHGSLFQKAYRRKLIEPESLKNLIQYIHRNPVHHGYVERAEDYPWSSYSSVLHEDLSAFNDVQAVLTIYAGQTDFVELHDQYVNDWLVVNPFEI